MAKGFKHGAGGGASLNFKVIGNPQPETAKDNTIWVDTDVKITSWVFSATQPETAEEGVVWFTTGTSSTAPFNALKKNGIMVYPLTAQQYVSGAWVDKTAKSYQNGALVDWWNGELYDTGNEYETFTGGWTATALSSTTQVTKDTTSMTIKTDYGDDALYCSKKIDLTHFKKLVVDSKNGTTTSSAEHRDGRTKVCVWSAIDGDGSSNRVAYVDYPAKHDGELELDVSALTGEYYVGIFAGKYYYVTVRKVKLS
jgi:hypothetical protein